MGDALHRLALVTLLAGCVANPAPTTESARPCESPPGSPADEPTAAGYKLSYERPFVEACWNDPERLEPVRAQIDALGDRIDRLDAGADASAAYVELLRVLRQPCFSLAIGEGVPEAPDNGLAMRTWWEDGGEEWLRHYLELFDWSEPRFAIVPPTMRRTLTSDTHREHPLTRWMCPAGELQCTDETERGYLAEFIDDMAMTSTGLGALSIGGDDHEGTTIEFNWGACSDTVSLAGEDYAYAALRDCIELATPRHWDLPIGGFRAPERGWLVVQGRRGHYTFCDELAVFDLVSGASYQAKSCGGILCAEGDDRCEHPQYEWRRGNVDPATVRAALWAMMWSDEAEPGVVRAATQHVIPDNVHARRPGRPELRVEARLSGGSGHTQLTWSYGVDRKHGFEGTLGWPNGGGHGGRDYATERLRALEETFVEGCPNAAFPDVPLFARAYGVSPVDAHPAQVAVTQQKLVDTLAADAAQPCPASNP